MHYQTILNTLISYDTISSESNLALIEWIENYLQALGIYYQRLEDETGLAKASLIARIGPVAEGGLIFSGHTDVVPVKDQAWSADPFVMRDTGDKFIGRGVCDMKGFIACLLANAPLWQKQALKKPIYFAFSYDEEVGCDKAPRIAHTLQAWGAQSAFAIIGEPTLLAPVVGQKGIVNIRTTVIGMAAHSSQILHQGISAVHEAGKLVRYIEQVMYDLIEDGELNPAFNVPHSSLHVGMIQGGIAHNVLARECTLDWEIRNLPEQSIESLLARMQHYADKLCAQNPELRIETQLTSAIVPGLINQNNEALLALLAKHLPNTPPEHVAYATEAGHFQQAGFQTVILGPGSILQAHQPDEWIEKTQLEQCCQLLNALVQDVCLSD